MGNLGKIIVATSFEKLPKTQWIVQSGYTVIGTTNKKFPVSLKVHQLHSNNWCFGETWLNVNLLNVENCYISYILKIYFIYYTYHLPFDNFVNVLKIIPAQTYIVRLSYGNTSVVKRYRSNNASKGQKDCVIGHSEHPRSVWQKQQHRMSSRRNQVISCTVFEAILIKRDGLVIYTNRHC